MRVHRHRLRVGAVAVCLTVMCALAGAVAARVYHGPLLTGLVAGAALAAFAIGFLLRNRASWLSATVSTWGLAAYLLGAFLLTDDGAEPLPQMLTDAIVNAVPRTLTALIPVEAAPDTVGVPVFLTWIAAGVGCEFAIRYGRTLLGCLLPTLLYAAGLYLVGPNAGADVPVTVAYCLAAGTALAVTAAPPGRRPDRDAEVDGGVPKRNATVLGSMVGAAVLLVAVAAIAPLASGLVTSRPGDPRELVEPPQLTDIDLNPLVRIAEWTKYPETELFRANLDGDAAMRLAVLTEYDGVTWQAGGDFRTAGSVLPGSGGGDFHAEVEIIELGGKLVPAVPEPATVTDLPIAVNLHTRGLLTPDGLATGDRYSVGSDPLDMDPEAAVDARADLSDPAGVAIPPGTPEIMQTIAEYITATYDTPHQRAQGLADFLSQHYAFDPQAPSGHDYPSLEFFLEMSPEAGGQRGTSEHFAASYAMIARLVGLPTRVVVGFEVPGGESTVTAAQGLAWPEVDFDGVGWVRFDPMPAEGTEPIPPQDTLEQMEEEEQETEEPSGDEGAEDYNDPSLEEQDGDFDAEEAAEEDRIPQWVWWAAAALALASVPLVLKARRRLRQRRRLRRGGPAERVAGAWAEVLAAAARAGVKVGPHANAEEAAVQVSALDADIDGLPRLVNQAAFAPDSVAEPDAEAAARIAVAFCKRTRPRVSRWRRVFT
ncbi:hypothetical protein GCM10027447_01640 [Glycomyces halotolerans]